MKKLGREPLGTSLILLVALPPLAFLHVYPWTPGDAEPIVLGVIPMPLLMWILWTLLLGALVVYVVLVRDPLSFVSERVERDPYADVDDGAGSPHSESDGTEDPLTH